MLLPNAYYGKAGEAQPLLEMEDDDEEDKLLKETPKSVIDMLGFDPLEFEESKNSTEDSSGIRYISFAGVSVAIEYEINEQRTLYNDADEVVYDERMQYPYGFIQGTTGRDGDEIDVALGTDEDAPDVFVVDMIDLGPDVNERENEDKVFLGFSSLAAAKKAFFSMYPKNFFGGMVKMPLKEFKAAMLTGSL